MNRSLKKKFIFISLLLFCLKIVMPDAVYAAEPNLSVPVLVSATSASYNSVKVTWKAVSGAASYNLYYRRADVKNWTTVKRGITSTQYTHVSSTSAPLAVGQEYFYTVRAVAGTVSSGYDKIGKSAVPTLNTPTLISATAPCEYQQKITWKAVAGADGYFVYRKEGTSWNRIAVVGAVTSYTYSDTNSTPILGGQTYTYTVRAYRKVDGVAYYSLYNKTGISCTVPMYDRVTVSFLSNDGSTLYQTISVSRNSSILLPGHADDPGYTFMGWDSSMGKTVDPKYWAGKTLVVSRDLNLYAVCYNHRRSVSYSTLFTPQFNPAKYSKVIFVGDSRTYRMMQTLENQFDPAYLKNVYFVALGGAGLSWFNESGYSELLSIVGKGGTLEKPVAIIFNMGINDLENISDYIKKIKSIAPGLISKKCLLYYESVNPANDAILRKNGSKSRPESTILKFNDRILSELCNTGLFQYIDVYTYLMKTGFAYDSGRGIDTGINDGAHYSTTTYRSIYTYIINYLNSK